MLHPLHEVFVGRYGTAPRIFRAPGRVNLIGEHTDYNDGFVLPIAIDRATRVAAAPRDDRRVEVTSLALEGPPARFDLDAPYARRDWSDYVQGVAVSLMEEGMPLRGANLLIESDVPIGSGLSSSAALEVSSALAFLGVAGAVLDRRRLAQVCQRAENQFVGMPCGIMDQFIACLAERKHALRLDCRSLAYEQVPLPIDAAHIVVCDTLVKHSLASSAYNERRRECAEGVRRLQAHKPDIRALRDVDPATYEALAHHLPEVVRKRCRHVVYENARVLQAVQSLRAGDLTAFGRHMYASHESLRDDYAVSCSELDFLVDAARRLPGVFGARMTGGGFGGCTVQLVAPDATDAFGTAIRESYRKRFGLDSPVYVLDSAPSAAELSAGGPQGAAEGRTGDR